MGFFSGLSGFCFLFGFFFFFWTPGLFCLHKPFVLSNRANAAVAYVALLSPRGLQGLRNLAKIPCAGARGEPSRSPPRPPRPQTMDCSLLFRRCRPWTMSHQVPTPPASNEIHASIPTSPLQGLGEAGDALHHAAAHECGACSSQPPSEHPGVVDLAPLGCPDLAGAVPAQHGEAAASLRIFSRQAVCVRHRGRFQAVYGKHEPSLLSLMLI